MLFKKGTKLYSIINGKCPQCQKGRFFKNRITFNLSKVTEIDDNCSSCGLKYMLEPSFYYGAMYVNYGITVAISIVTFLIAKLLFNLSLLQCFASIIITLLIIAPITLRLARILWINMFVNYKK